MKVDDREEEKQLKRLTNLHTKFIKVVYLTVMNLYILLCTVDILKEKAFKVFAFGEWEIAGLFYELFYF